MTDQRVSRTSVPIFVGSLALLLLFAVHRFAPTAFANYVLLADAWLHHRLWIISPGPYIDAMPYNGHWYVIEAPFPAILMLPFVGAQGTSANQTLVGAIVAAIGVGALYRLVARLGVRTLQARIILVFFAFFGTSFFWCAVYGDVWSFAHVCGFTFSALALAEALGKQRGARLALWASAAALSRYSLAPAALVYLIWLLLEKRDSATKAFALVTIPIALAWCAYNEARFGTPYDPGFSLWYQIMDPRARSGVPIFSIAHFSMQIEAFFVRPLQRVAAFPWLVPPRFGFAMTWSSFAFLGAVLTLGQFRQRRVVLLWCLTALAAIPDFLYFDTGGYQFGMRHALDFEPFLIILLAIAVTGRYRRPILTACILCIAFGAYEMGVWVAFQRLIA